jgi:hypothetical protein
MQKAKLEKEKAEAAALLQQTQVEELITPLSPQLSKRGSN